MRHLTIGISPAKACAYVPQDTLMATTNRGFFISIASIAPALASEANLTEFRHNKTKDRGRRWRANPQRRARHVRRSSRESVAPFSTATWQRRTRRAHPPRRRRHPCPPCSRCSAPISASMIACPARVVRQFESCPRLEVARVCAFGWGAPPS